MVSQRVLPRRRRRFAVSSFLRRRVRVPDSFAFFPRFVVFFSRTARDVFDVLFRSGGPPTRPSHVLSTRSPRLARNSSFRSSARAFPAVSRTSFPGCGFDVAARCDAGGFRRHPCVPVPPSVHLPLASHVRHAHGLLSRRTRHVHVARVVVHAPKKPKTMKKCDVRRCGASQRGCRPPRG